MSSNISYPKDSCLGYCVEALCKMLTCVCWPPIQLIPRIISFLAFHPPIPSTYDIRFDPNLNKWQLFLKKEIFKFNRMLLNVNFNQFIESMPTFDVFFSKTSLNNRITCLFIRFQMATELTLFISNSNAADLGVMSGFYWLLGQRINCNIFTYDYSGYGLSNGKPSEANIHADIDSAFKSLITLYNIRPKTTILFGISIGSVPTIDLSTRVEFLGVILESAILSGLRTLCPKYVNRIWSFDPFPNIVKVNRIKSKVLVMHGTEDNLIDINDAKRLYNCCKNKVEPFWAQGCAHNGLYTHPEYFNRIRHFIDVELEFDQKLDFSLLYL